MKADRPSPQHYKFATPGRHRQVVIAALDPQSLEAWVGLNLPVLDFSHFGDASDFRGIGADQARFLRQQKESAAEQARARVEQQRLEARLARE